MAETAAAMTEMISLDLVLLLDMGQSAMDETAAQLLAGKEAADWIRVTWYDVGGCTGLQVKGSSI